MEQYKLSLYVIRLKIGRSSAMEEADMPGPRRS
jgi:hypothetical protein